MFIFSICIHTYTYICVRFYVSSRVNLFADHHAGPREPKQNLALLNGAVSLQLPPWNLPCWPMISPFIISTYNSDINLQKSPANFSQDSKTQYIHIIIQFIYIYTYILGSTLFILVDSAAYSLHLDADVVPGACGGCSDRRGDRFAPWSSEKTLAVRRARAERKSPTERTVDEHLSCVYLMYIWCTVCWCIFDECRCTLMCVDVSWCIFDVLYVDVYLMNVDVRWCVLMYLDVYLMYCMLMYIWWMSMYVDVCWCILMYIWCTVCWCIFDECRCTLMCVDVSWCIFDVLYVDVYLMNVDVRWCVLMYLDVYLMYCMLMYIWWMSMYVDVCWCILMCVDVWWCVLMYVDVRWCVLMYLDVCWCMLMYVDVCWCVLMCVDVWWCMLMCVDVWWCTLMYVDVCWCVMMYVDMWWSMLMFVDVLMYVDVCWCMLMYVDLSWTYEHGLQMDCTWQHCNTWCFHTPESFQSHFVSNCIESRKGTTWRTIWTVETSWHHVMSTSLLQQLPAWIAVSVFTWVVCWVFVAPKDCQDLSVLGSTPVGFPRFIYVS